MVRDVIFGRDYEGKYLSVRHDNKDARIKRLDFDDFESVERIFIKGCDIVFNRISDSSDKAAKLLLRGMKGETPLIDTARIVSENRDSEGNIIGVSIEIDSMSCYSETISLELLVYREESERWEDCTIQVS